MADKSDDDARVRALLNKAPQGAATPRLARNAVVRARRVVGQKDTLVFLLVKIWAALARVLAPFFAAFAEKQASHGGRHGRSTRKPRPFNSTEFQ